LISLITVPIYTRSLGPQGYGNFNIAMAFESVLVACMSLGLTSGMVRSYGLARDEARRLDIVTTAFYGSLALAILSAFFAVAIRRLSPFVLPFQGNSSIFLLVGVLTAVDLVLFNLLSAFRSMERAIAYALVVILRSLLTVPLALWLVWRAKGGVYAAISIQLLCGLAALLLAMGLGRRAVFAGKFSLSALYEMLGFGVWLIPGNIAGWALSLSDRYIIQFYLGSANVGIYSLGYRLGSLIEIGLKTPFSLAWSPIIFRAFRENRIMACRLITRTFTIFNALGIFFSLGLGLFAEDLIRLFSTEEYLPASVVIPMVALTVLVSSWENMLGIGLYVYGKTYFFPIILLFGAVVNLTLDILLVPRWGINAAALMKLLAYVLIGILHFFISSKYVKCQIEVAKVAALYGAGAIFYLLGLSLTSVLASNLLATAVARSLVLLAFLGCLLWFRVISPSQLKKLAVIKGACLERTENS
jgi:O-antigen/teichoic acid export membrane protein